MAWKGRPGSCVERVRLEVVGQVKGQLDQLHWDQMRFREEGNELRNAKVRSLGKCVSMTLLSELTRA